MLKACSVGFRWHGFEIMRYEKKPTGRTVLLITEVGKHALLSQRPALKSLL